MTNPTKIADAGFLQTARKPRSKVVPKSVPLRPFQGGSEWVRRSKEWQTTRQITCFPYKSVPPTGIEPVASALGKLRSIQLSYEGE